MNSLDVYNKMKELFDNIQSFRCLSEIDDYIKSLSLDSQIQSFYDKYPRYKFGIDPVDILTMVSSGIIDKNNKLDTNNFNGTPLEKLLVAALWKNGDINKIQHIIDGILEVEGFRTNNSLIFKQFGHSLRNSLEPIVDQHVLRAYEVFLSIYSDKKVCLLRKKDNYNNSDYELLKSYKDWFKNLIYLIPINEQLEFKEKLDKILFINGKAIKISKRKSTDY